MSHQWTGEWHSLAARFPMLSEDELRDMADSIAEHGQFVPCRMDAAGLGLDGRNRTAACQLAGIEPLWEVYEGDAIAFIVEVNAERRHLTTGQRAMAVAIGLVEAGLRDNGRFTRGSVPGDNRSAPNNWRDRVSDAGLVLDHAPELADPVLRGELALDAAHRQADEIRRRNERLDALGGELPGLVKNGVINLEEAERRIAEEVRLGELAPDLANRVRAGNLDLGEAETIAAESRRRVIAWAEQVNQALDVLRRMAGYPIPDDLTEHLQGAAAALLPAVLATIDQEEAHR